MKSNPLPAVALLALLAVPVHHARADAAIAACEQNFQVEGSWANGRTYSTEALVEGARYPEALHQVRDKLVELGLEIVAVQERNGYIRAAQPVKGGGGGTSRAPLRGYVTAEGEDRVRVSLQFTIAGGQMTSRKGVMENMCALVAAAAH